MLLDGTLGKNVQDFRTYLVAVERAADDARRGRRAVPAAPGTLTVSVSWNGATEVASWRVLAGASASALAPVADGRQGAASRPTIKVPTRRALRAGAGAGRAPAT